jgi:hypothetical protein
VDFEKIFGRHESCGSDGICEQKHEKYFEQRRIFDEYE